MTDPVFDHEKRDVYHMAVEYVAESLVMAKGLSGLHRHAPDQWLRAAQSIRLHIAEGKGKRSLKDRARFVDISRGSARQCAAMQDVLVVSGGIDAATGGPPKAKRKRIVALLTRLALRSDRLDKSAAWYDPNIDYDYEYEHGYEYEHE